jgi:hypothetical protein
VPQQFADAAAARLLQPGAARCATVCGDALAAEEPVDEREFEGSGLSLLPSASSSSASDATARSTANSSASIDTPSGADSAATRSEVLETGDEVVARRPAPRRGRGDERHRVGVILEPKTDSTSVRFCRRQPRRR